MINNKKIINSVWVGDTLPIVIQVCIKSWIDNEFEYHLWVYEKDCKNVPDGVVIEDANTIIPKEHITYQKHYPSDVGTLDGFYNWFKFECIYQNGGMFTDIDIVCLNGDYPIDEIFFIDWRIINFPKEHVFCNVLRKIGKNPELASLQSVILRKNTLTDDYLKEARMLLKTPFNNESFERIMKNNRLLKYINKYFDRRIKFPNAYDWLIQYCLYDERYDIDKIDTNIFYGIKFDIDLVRMNDDNVLILNDSCFHQLISKHLPNLKDKWIGTHNIYE